MSSRPLTSAAYLLPPATDPIGPATHRPQPDIAGRTLRSAAGAIETEATAKPDASPRLYQALRCDPQDQAACILVKTEKLLRTYGHHKIRVAEIADACGFSAANVYRYFSTRSAILDALASHYLREAERTALAGVIRGGCSARDRLDAFLIGLNTALIIFSDSEPKVSELLADAAAEQRPCYLRHDARVVRRIAVILAAGKMREGGRLCPGRAGRHPAPPRQVRRLRAQIFEPLDRGRPFEPICVAKLSFATLTDVRRCR